jgi:SAM-dependent methyltransferase
MDRGRGGVEHCSSGSHALCLKAASIMTSPKARLQPPRAGALWAAAWQRIPEGITRTLASGGAALEVGCGSGLACLALAEAVPRAQIVGHDDSPDEIVRARELARAAGLDTRVRFAVDDSTRLPRATYHLITAQALRERHPTPLLVLNAIRNALVPSGTCLLLEPPTIRPSRAFADLPTLARQAGFSRIHRLPGAAHLPLYELRR